MDLKQYRTKWCHGLGDTYNFKRKEKEKLYALIKDVRQNELANIQTVDHDAETYFGSRYKDDDWVYSYIQSGKHAHRKIKQNQYRELVLDALIGCARADYYYQFEKDWG